MQKLVNWDGSTSVHAIGQTTATLQDGGKVFLPTVSMPNESFGQGSEVLFRKNSYGKSYTWHSDGHYVGLTRA